MAFARSGWTAIIQASLATNTSAASVPARSARPGGRPERRRAPLEKRSFMVIILTPAATDADVADLQRRLQEFGYQSHLSRGEERTLVGAVGAAPPNKAA